LGCHNAQKGHCLFSGRLQLEGRSNAAITPMRHIRPLMIEFQMMRCFEAGAD
jgi:hypothetical protein